MKNIILLFSIFTSINFLFAQNNFSFQTNANDNLYLISSSEISYKNNSIEGIPKKYTENKYLNKKENQLVTVIYSVVDVNKMKDWKYGTNLFKVENITVQNSELEKREYISFKDKNENSFVVYISNPKLPKNIDKDFLKSNIIGDLFNLNSKQKFTYIILEIKRIKRNQYFLKVFQSPEGYDLKGIMKKSINSNYIMYLEGSSKKQKILKMEKM